MLVVQVLAYRRVWERSNATECPSCCELGKWTFDRSTSDQCPSLRPARRQVNSPLTLHTMCTKQRHESCMQFRTHYCCMDYRTVHQIFTITDYLLTL